MLENKVLHAKSAACMKSELDLFSVPPTQSSIIGSHHVLHQPLSTLTDAGPVEFFISGTGDEYIDVSDILLQVRCKVLTPDGGNLPNQAVVAPENNLLHTLWAQIDCLLNDTVITNSNHTYAHNAYLETLLAFGHDATKTHLQTQFWYRDDDDVNSANPDHNSGFRVRQELAAGSRPIDMIGKLHLDFFKQPKLLINNVSIKLRFTRNSDAFCLHAANQATPYKIRLLDVSLLVRKCKINPSVQAAHLLALEKTNARYPVKRVVSKIFSEPAGSLAINKENLFLGELPSRLVVGLLNNTAYHGSYSENPFNFRHLNTSSICLHLDGRSIPSQPLRPDFRDNYQCYVRSYQQMLEALGKTDSPESNTISLKDYCRGFTLWVFDLTPDQAGDAQHLNTIKHGSLRLEIHFRRALQHTVSILAQGEFDNLIEIDKFRNVLVDYAN